MRSRSSPIVPFPAALAAVAALAVAGCGREQAPPSAGASEACRPNVIVYLIDTLRRDHLGLYGYGRATSPAIDGLARDAVVFDRAYATSAWTRPSAASLLTGLYPVRHGANAYPDRLSDSIDMLAERLKPLGYRTAAFVSNPHVLGTWGFAQGFDLFRDVGATSTEWDRVGSERVGSAFIEDLDDLHEPFFAYLHTIDPHTPVDPPPPYDRLFTDSTVPVPRWGGIGPETPASVLERLEALYDAEIRHNDDRLGELIEELRERGLYERSAIFVVSDHGEEFLDHGLGGHSRQLWNEVARVPLLLKLPASAHAGTRVHAPVSLVDVLPTILSLACQQPDPTLEGRDLRGLLEGSPAGARPLFLNLDRIDDDGKTVRQIHAVVLGDWKYIEEIAPQPSRFLFDQRRDPEERTNLVDREPAVAGRLAELLETYLADAARGLHLRVVGAGDDQTRTIEGRLSTSGRFRSVRLSQGEPEDRATLDASGEVSFRLVLRDFGLGPAVQGGRRRARDVDGLVLEVEPHDAAVRVEALRAADGQPLALFAGSERRPLGHAPAEIQLGDRALVGDPAALSASEDPSVAAGAYLLVSATPAHETAEMSADVEQRLRALGYLDGEP